MNMTRRSLCVATAMALAGCASRLNEELHYEEQFDALAISPDGSMLAVVGKKYDYIFKPPRELVEALRSSLRPRLSADFQNFELGSPSAISGRWILHFTDDHLPAETSALARTLGFVDEGGGRYVLSGRIQGARYLKNDAKRVDGGQPTNRPYTVKVSQAQGAFTYDRPQRSPITFQQGAMVIGLVLLLPLLLLLRPCLVCK